jgi:large subunit ribosomal protein L33
MSQDHVLGLQCTKCKKTNYSVTRNKKKVPEKLKPMKYCKHCRVKTEHKEVKNFG